MSSVTTPQDVYTEDPFCRWFFPCDEWLDREKGNSRVLLAQLEDPRLASNMADYQVPLNTASHQC